MLSFCHLSNPKPTLYRYVYIICVSFTPNLHLLAKAIMLYQDVLPSTTPTYEYKGVQDFLQILDRELEHYERNELSNPYIVLFIDERSFLDYYVDSEEGLSRTSWNTYDPSCNELVIRLQTRIHSAGALFAEIVRSWPGSRDENHRLLPTPTVPVRGHSGMTKRSTSHGIPYVQAAHRNIRLW